MEVLGSDILVLGCLLLEAEYLELLFGLETS